MKFLRDFGKKGNEEKRLWLATEAKSEWLPPFAEWQRQHQGTTQISYVERWIEQCNAGTIKTIRVSTGDGVWPVIRDKLNEVDRFGLSLQDNQKFDIKDKRIHEIVIGEANSITLKNCAVRRLIFRSQHGQGQPRVSLINCDIGRLELTGTVGTFELLGGSIHSLTAPTPSQQSPLTGSVEIRGVRLSPAFENAQAYRNLRHHLTSLHNHEAASVFHAAEMQAEVSRQSYIDKTISAFYRAISNYGGSSARPLAIFACLLLLHTTYLYFMDGAVPLGDASEADGWRYDLYGLDIQSRMLRSAVFALNQTINPFGVFGTRLLLAAKTPMIALISGTLGIATTLAFTLFVLAVRRRFRLDRG